MSCFTHVWYMPDDDLPHLLECRHCEEMATVCEDCEGTGLLMISADNGIEVVVMCDGCSGAGWELYQV